MKTYRVFATYQTEACIDIKADNEEEAHDEAYEDLASMVALDRPRNDDDQWVDINIDKPRILNIVEIKESQ